MFTSTSLFPEVIPISINSNFWFQFYALIGWSLRTFQGIFFLLMATDVAAWESIHPFAPRLHAGNDVRFLRLCLRKNFLLEAYEEPWSKKSIKKTYFLFLVLSSCLRYSKQNNARKEILE